MLSYFGKRSGNFSEAKHLESMARRWMITKRTWSQTSKTSQRDFTAKVWQTLQAKLTGHYQYYNINDNWRWIM